MRYIPETSMLWRLEQEDCRECEASLVHLASSRPPRLYHETQSPKSKKEWAEDGTQSEECSPVRNKPNTGDASL